MTEFSELLNIPNLNKKLEWLSQDQQNNIMKFFLDFFLQIKKAWMYFENQIWNDTLTNILDNLINAEVFGNESMDYFMFMNKPSFTFSYWLEHWTLDSEEYQNWINEIEETLRQYNNPKEYYIALANAQMDEVKWLNNSNIDRDRELHITNEINQYIGQLAELRKMPNDEAIKQQKREIYYDLRIL